MSESRFDRTVLSLLGVTLLALAIRLWELGGRIFHWDEGRVGYWALRYAETGEFSYAPIIHGPFLPLVNGTLFRMFGASDTTARVVVAVIGGLLPLSVWLFRNHLRESELIVAGGLLAFNPLLVYYSRFMRNDVLVGGFALVALGFAVRALESRKIRYCYPGVAFLALSVTTKANTILYVLCFAGAAVLLLDHRLVRRAAAGDAVREHIRLRAETAGADLKRAAGGTYLLARVGAHLVGLGSVFTLIIVAFYAPRPFVYDAVSRPSQWSELLRVSTIGAAAELWELWITGGMQGNPYFQYLYAKLVTLSNTSAIVVSFAVIGFLVDGYVREPVTSSAPRAVADGGDEFPDRSEQDTQHTETDSARTAGSDIEEDRADVSGKHAPSDDTESLESANLTDKSDTGPKPTWNSAGSRALVAFSMYWGLASLIGYPVATDIEAPWSAIHIVVPLVFPAAVGLVWAGETGLQAVRTDDRVTAVLVSVVLIVAVGGLMLPNAAYWNSTNPNDTAIIQYSQPHNDVRDTVTDITAITAATDGPHVMFVGTQLPGRGATFYMANESAANQQPAMGGWYDRLPLPWYLERAGAERVSTPTDTSAAEIGENPPPVVIAHVDDRDRLEPHLDGYATREHELRQHGFRVVVFTDQDAISERSSLHERLQTGRNHTPTTYGM